jgi:hypothetical protein
MNMMQTAQVPPALEALMSMGARPTAPGPGGQPVPTVAASIAQQQSPAGIEAVMPGVQQQAMNMAQAQQPVTMGQLPPQLQQAIQQARGPQGQGVAGLPAANMSFADGGVVGYAGTEGSFVGVTPTYEEARRLGITLSPYDPPAVRKEKLERLQKMREFEKQRQSFGEIPTEASQANERALAQAFSPAAQERRMLDVPQSRVAAPRMEAEPEVQAPAQNAPPQFDIDPNNPQALNALRRAAMSATGVEQQALLSKIAELESAQVSQPVAASGIAAALPGRPALDRASVASAGTQYGAQTADRIKRMQEIERQRSEMAKGMPDLNAEGIAALEATNRAREEMLAKQRSDDKFNRRMGLYRELGGRDRDAYNRTVAAQQARDQAAVQADLLHRQAVLKLREAQQAKQLGQFDRALGFEKEAAELENKANDFELRAKQIATQMATNEFSGLVSLRGQDMQAQRELKSMAPAEQMMAERAINDWLNKNPGKSYSDAVEWYKNIGRAAPADRSVITYDQAADNVTKFMDSIPGMQEIAAIRKRAKDAGQPVPSMAEIRDILIRREMEGGGRTPAGAAPASGGQPMYARNPSTGARIMSTDGGQTWKPVQ